jgi:hypothetical protein
MVAGAGATLAASARGTPAAGVARVVAAVMGRTGVVSICPSAFINKPRPPAAAPGPAVSSGRTASASMDGARVNGSDGVDGVVGIVEGRAGVLARGAMAGWAAATRVVASDAPGSAGAEALLDKLRVMRCGVRSGMLGRGVGLINGGPGRPAATGATSGVVAEAGRGVGGAGAGAGAETVGATMGSGRRGDAGRIASMTPCQMQHYIM